MTEQEIQTIVAAVIDSLKTNGKTIDQLTAVTTMGTNDFIELNGGRKVKYSVLYDQLYTAAQTVIEADKGDTWTAINALRQHVSRLQHQVDINGEGLDTLTSRFGQLFYTVSALADKLGELAEVYCTEAEYNAMVDAGTIDPNTKYFIYES